MKKITLIALAAILLLSGCKKQAAEETQTTIGTETTAVTEHSDRETAIPESTDPALEEAAVLPQVESTTPEATEETEDEETASENAVVETTPSEPVETTGAAEQDEAAPAEYQNLNENELPPGDNL